MDTLAKHLSVLCKQKFLSHQLLSAIWDYMGFWEKSNLRVQEWYSRHTGYDYFVVSVQGQTFLLGCILSVFMCVCAWLLQRLLYGSSLRLDNLLTTLIDFVRLVDYKVLYLSEPVCIDVMRRKIRLGSLYVWKAHPCGCNFSLKFFSSFIKLWAFSWLPHELWAFLPVKPS